MKMKNDLRNNFEKHGSALNSRVVSFGGEVNTLVKSLVEILKEPALRKEKEMQDEIQFKNEKAKEVKADK